MRFFEKEWLNKVRNGEDLEATEGVIAEEKVRSEEGKRRLSKWEKKQLEQWVCDNNTEAIKWFCNEMSQSKKWADAIALQGISKVLDLTIVVFDVETGVIWQYAREGRPELYVRFVNRNHYQFMEAEKEGVDVSVTCNKKLGN